MKLILEVFAASRLSGLGDTKVESTERLVPSLQEPNHRFLERSVIIPPLTHAVSLAPDIVLMRSHELRQDLTGIDLLFMLLKNY